MSTPTVLIFAWVILAVIWLLAMPADFRGKRWHHVHLLLIPIPVIAAALVPPPLGQTIELYARCGALVAVMAVVAWSIGGMARNHGIMDIVYPVFAAGIAAFVFIQAGEVAGAHARLLMALVTIWALRLIAHAARTNLRVEQEPYATLRRRYGRRWRYWSLFAVYGLQGVIVWLWAAPFAFAMTADASGLSWYSLAGTAVWITGFLFQAIGDRQLKQFKQDPANRGKLMQHGLWSVTRHPNYFGECLMWLAYAVFALQHPWGWLSLFAPAYVIWFMGYGSAAPGNERHMRKTRPEAYEEYSRRVPRLFPRLMRRSKS